jgi:hypothetical protein
VPLYTISRPSFALNTNNDTLTVVASNTKPLRLMIVDLKGLGNSAAANEVRLSRSSGGTSPVNTSTPAVIGKLNSASPAPSFSVYTGWTGQPTLTETLWPFSVNANGGQDKFIALPGAEISVRVGEQVSIRSASGTSNVSVALLVEEMDG